MKLLFFKKNLILFIKSLLRLKGGKLSFLRKIPKNSRILDLGCGNNSSVIVKTICPNSYYVGIDVVDLNNNCDVNQIADKYILTDPDSFVKSIKSLNLKFDSIISSHNLEHCNDRYGTLNAMIDKLNYKGKIYISFPSRETIKFPSRQGTLNYYDDPTHKDLPPDFNLIKETFHEKGLKIIFSSKNYKPLLLKLLGYLTEPLSNHYKKVYPGVWERWGFESIIIAEKIRQ